MENNPILAEIERRRFERVVDGGALTTYSEKVDRDLSKTCHGDWSHEEVASHVRMLMRNDIDHEVICTTARDRIIWLARRVAELEAMVQPEGNLLREVVSNMSLDAETHNMTDKKFEYANYHGTYDGRKVLITLRVDKNVR